MKSCAMHTRTEQRVRGSDKTHPTNTLTNRVLESNSLLCLAPAIPAIGTSPFVSFVNGVSHNHKSHSHIHKQLPQDGEHHTLQSIRQNPCLKASSKQSSPSICRNNIHCSGGIRYLGFVHLAVCLHNTKRVRRGI